jgi:hypothetical protein
MEVRRREPARNFERVLRREACLWFCVLLLVPQVKL